MARQPAQELGSNCLMLAYHFETWDVAARLEANGQNPDPPRPVMNSPMYFATPAAWSRVLAQGYDPMEHPSTPANPHPRWVQWIGPRLPSFNEETDPFRAMVVDWARTHDPQALMQWQINYLAYQFSRSSASCPSNTTALVDRLATKWQLPSTWFLHSDTERGGQVWLLALRADPEEWTARLRAHHPQLPLSPGLLWQPLVSDPPSLSAVLSERVVCAWPATAWWPSYPHEIRGWEKDRTPSIKISYAERIRVLSSHYPPAACLRPIVAIFAATLKDDLMLERLYAEGLRLPAMRKWMKEHGDRLEASDVEFVTSRLSSWQQRDVLREQISVTATSNRPPRL